MFMADHVIDGENQVLGRLGSQVAKLLLNGDKVTIINAEKVVISGHHDDIKAKYKQLIELKDKANPEHSPYWSRRPDLFVKRSIRGMLPYKKPKGKEAFDRLRAYIAVPDEFKSKKQHKIETKDAKDIYENVMTVKELVTELGYKGNA